MARETTTIKMPDFKPRIGKASAGIIIGVAVFFDFFQALLGSIPVVGVIFGWLISITAFMTFFVWFKFHGVTFSENAITKLATMFGGFFIEMMPVLNMLPGWTLSVVLTLAIVNFEDKQRAKERRQKIERLARQLHATGSDNKRRRRQIKAAARRLGSEPSMA